MLAFGGALRLGRADQPVTPKPGAVGDDKEMRCGPYSWNEHIGEHAL